MHSTVVKKRLIVCCDGTWNDSVSNDSPLTNASRISRLSKAVDDEDGAQQVVSYQIGVGSGTSRLGNLIDGMNGRGEDILHDIESPFSSSGSVFDQSSP